jgi:hypothetical protein
MGQSNSNSNTNYLGLQAAGPPALPSFSRERTAQPILLFLFLSAEHGPQAMAQPSQARLSPRPLIFRPRQLTSGTRLSAFPSSSRSAPLRPAALRLAPLASPRDKALQPPLPFARAFSPFPSAAAPLARVTCQHRSLLVPAPRHGSETAVYPVSTTEPRHSAAIPPHIPARTSRSPGCNRSPNPSATYKSLSHSRNPSHPCFSPPAVAAPAEEKEKKRRRRRKRRCRSRQGGERRQAVQGGGGCHRRGPPPGRRPNDDINEAARPARPRPTCTGPSPRQGLRQRASPVSTAAALPLLSLVLSAMPMSPL